MNRLGLKRNQKVQKTKRSQEINKADQKNNENTNSKRLSI